MYRDREKPGYRLGPENCSEDQRIFQLKLEICNTTLIKSIKSPTDIGSPIDIGSPTDIERPINVNNTFGNKEVDHLFCRDFEEIDHLF